MKINKLKYLAIALFLSNVKSVHLQPANGDVYQYREMQPNRNITQENNKQAVNGTILEYMIDQDIKREVLNILENFILEILMLPDNETIFTIQNNLDVFTYQVIKNDHLIKIERTGLNPIQNTHIIKYKNINYTVLAYYI